MSVAPVDPAGEHEAPPSSLTHLTDRELLEQLAHAVNAHTEQLTWLVGKLVQAEAIIASAANDPKLRMLMPKLGG